MTLSDDQLMGEYLLSNKNMIDFAKALMELQITFFGVEKAAVEFELATIQTKSAKQESESMVKRNTLLEQEAANRKRKSELELEVEHRVFKITNVYRIRINKPYVPKNVYTEVEATKTAKVLNSKKTQKTRFSERLKNIVKRAQGKV